MLLEKIKTFLFHKNTIYSRLRKKKVSYRTEKFQIFPIEHNAIIDLSFFLSLFPFLFWFIFHLFLFSIFCPILIFHTHNFYLSLSLSFYLSIPFSFYNYMYFLIISIWNILSYTNIPSMTGWGFGCCHADFWKSRTIFTTGTYAAILRV